LTTLGVDYSYDPPTPAELVKWGAKFACRYLVGKAPKKLTLDEVQALNAVGIAIVSNFESTAGFMLSGGFNNGVAVAKEALAAATACGMPAGRPIYFSADTDPGGWTAAQWASFDAFLDGAASVLGKGAVGVYGGTLALQAARAGGSCTWFWQALGWRNGVWLSWAHLQQYDNGNVLGSGTVDYDRALTSDYGQWKVGDVPISDGEWTKFEALMDKYARWTARWIDHGDETVLGTGNNLAKVRGDVALVLRDLDDIGTTVDSLPSGQTVDPGLIAEAVVERLGPELAGALADELYARLAG
jgi:Domain of unknown function (DUF1906)